MAKKKQPKGGPLPQMPGTDPIGSVNPQTGGPIATPDQVTPNPQGPSGASEWWGAARPRVPFSGGGGGSKGPVGAGVSYDPEEMIRTYAPGYDQMTPEQQQVVRDELKGHLKESGGDFHKAISTMVQAHPEAFTSPWAKAFPQQKAGQLSPEVMSRLLQLTQQYQKPYLDQLNTISAGVSGSLQKLLPSLPQSYRGLIQAEIPVYANLGKQLGAALSAADPGQIATSYGQAYAPAATQTAANSLFNGLPSLSS